MTDFDFRKLGYYTAILPKSVVNLLCREYKIRTYSLTVPNGALSLIELIPDIINFCTKYIVTVFRTLVN